MVRRAHARLEQIAELTSLGAAFHRAAAGKRDREEVRTFESGLWPRLTDLRARLLDGAAPHNRYRRFQIRDPKPRVIHAPVFEDRIVHHALIGAIGPTLDAALVDDTFACRVGKGSFAAVHRAQHHLRRWPWYVKVDVAKYFASIPQDRLLGLLSKKIARPGTRALVRRIVQGFENAPGVGLPIGALTSQYFANYYLSPLDRSLLGHPLVRGMVRYMDDVVAWTESRAEARAILARLRELVPSSLGLRLKGAGIIQRSRAGLSFLGFRVYPGTLRLSDRPRRRYRAARQAWERAYADGDIDALGLQRGYDAALGITAHADARRFRQRDLERRPPAGCEV